MIVVKVFGGLNAFFQMVDILFRGGFTVAETINMQIYRHKPGAMSNKVAERRLRLADRSFHTKVGHVLESEEDYSEHYQALQEDAATSIGHFA